MENPYAKLYQAGKISPEKWLLYAKELQAIAQTGLHYTSNIFDRERYTRIQEISFEIMAAQSELSVEQVYQRYLTERGYCTPKIATLAAVFNEQDEILLVKEANDLWTLPGGWCDVNESIVSNTLKELSEEAGVKGEYVRLIALHDRKKHLPQLNFNVLLCFSECSYLSGTFEANSETLEAAYFAKNNLPKIAINKCSYEELALCFAAHQQGAAWQVEVD